MAVADNLDDADRVVRRALTIRRETRAGIFRLLEDDAEAVAELARLGTDPELAIDTIMKELDPRIIDKLMKLDQRLN
jgi:hypothetical protein